MSKPKEPKKFGPGRSVPVAELVDGVVVDRWTETRRDGLVKAPLPCHENQSVIVNPRVLPLTVACRKCLTAYRLTLHDDVSEGYTAGLVVANSEFQVSRAR